MGEWFRRKLFLILVVGTILVVWFQGGFSNYLTLESLKQNHGLLITIVKSHPLASSLGFALLYVVITGLSIPGAALLTIAAGAIFGVVYGTIIVSFASTIGATSAFLGARYLFRDGVEKKFREQLGSINRGLAKEGAFYLFSLRLIPAVPFFLINVLMGLTKFPTHRFYLVSQFGMLPGTIVYVNAGTQLAKIDSLRGILSLDLLLAFALLGVLPLISKWILEAIKSRRFSRRFKKPTAYDYNLVVIGAGAAGLVSAYMAAAVRAKVALIERHKMGGDCLNTGCVPSKALIRSAKIVKYMQRAPEFGLEPVSAEVRFGKVMERVAQVVSTIAPHDSVERYTGLGVECISGEAKILSPYEVQVGERILRTRNIVVASGARPWLPPIPGLLEVNPLTSDNLWNLRELPRRLLVMGGGPIGCELAQALARLGAKVTLVEMAERLMIREDVEVSQYVADTLQKDGVDVRLGHQAETVETRAGERRLICRFEQCVVEVPFDQILVAVGRKANVEGFGLEDLGVAMAPNGTVAANEYLRTTNYPNIYVCGDVTGPYQFTHTASHQAWYVTANALFSPLKKFKVDYRCIPWCTFTDPEVARVGLNELEAKAQGLDYEISVYGIDDLDRAIADQEAHGFVKVLTTRGSDKILGVTIVGAHAGEIIAEYVTAMKYGLGLNKILGTIHIYPTWAEANKYAAGVWKKKNAPAAALRWLERFHRWRRK